MDQIRRTPSNSESQNTYSIGQLVFPRDEGDKDTPFDWWYLTSHFITATGKKFSYTVVYISSSPTYCTRQTSITDETNKIFFKELIKGPFTPEKGLLNLKYSNPNGDQDYFRQKKDELFNYSLFTEIRKLYSLNITLTSNKPPLVHGGDGLIQMGTGGNSFYYSQTNLTLNGTFLHHGTTETIHGIAWIDRQWGSWNPKGYDDWEWFALQLNDNTEIMLYLFFDFIKGNKITPALSLMFNDGTFINSSDPKEFTLEYLGYWEAPDQNLLGRLVNLFTKWYFSSGWKLTIPKYHIALSIIPIIKNQRIGQNSWEGSCYVKGSHNGIAIDAISTVELTHRYAYPDQIRLAKNLIRKFLF